MTQIGYVTSTKASNACGVRVGAQTVSAQCPQDITPAVGDVVTIESVGSAYYIGARYFASAVAPPDTPPEEPPSAPTVVDGTKTFTPSRTASWGDRYGWRNDNDDVYQGEFGGQGNYIGCAFYGSKLQSLAGATVLGAWISVRRKNGGGITAAQTTTLGRITEASKPSGQPTFGGGITGPRLAWGKSDTHFDIPSSLAQSLVDGTYGGLGIHIAGSDPYVILQGIHSYAASFALTIKFRRSS